MLLNSGKFILLVLLVMPTTLLMVGNGMFILENT